MQTSISPHLSNASYLFDLFIAHLGAICDVRKPDVMRVAPAPLYNSFDDVYRFIHLLKELLK